MLGLGRVDFLCFCSAYIYHGTNTSDSSLISQIAKRLGDDAAAVKIRARLDGYDPMNDLPTIVNTHSSSCSNNEQEGEDNNEEKYNDGDGNDRLVDDFDKNILQ